MSAVRTETVFFVRDVLARRVEQRWRDCGIARIELCERVNCSRWTLAAMMRREVGVGIERVAAFANVFACSPSLLLDESEVGAPPTHAPFDVTSVRQVLAKNVARLRVACGFANVVALARAAGIGKTRLYEILAGRCDTSIDIVALLAVAFGARTCELLAVN